jgi:hypothetical protein
MSIKPVDLQVMIPRTMEVSKAVSDTSQKNQAMLQHQTSSTQNKVDNSLKQVYSHDNAHGVKISERQKNNQKNGKKEEEKKGKGGNKENKDSNTAFKTTTIDIKI